MSAVEWLIAADKQGRRLLWIEWRPQRRQSLFRPILRSSLCLDLHIEALRRNKQLVGVFESPRCDAVDPDSKGWTKRSARLLCRTDKVRDCGSASLNDAVAHPAHAAGMFDAVGGTKAKVARKIGAHRVGIENDCVKQRRERIAKRGLAGARQTHNENFSLHVLSAAPPQGLATAL